MDSLVSGLVQTVLGSLNLAITQDIGLVRGLEKELKKLESVFNTIQHVLEDAEVKQRKSKPLHNWLLKLKDAAYDVENILDEVATEALLRKVDSETGQIHKVNAFISRRNPLVFKFGIAHRVKSIRERLDVIADERLKFHLGEGVVVNNFRIGDLVAENRQTSSLVNESDIYGRNEERDLIIRNVVRGAVDCDDLSVYGICGMGGIGKTTLAQLLYNDERVKRYFELRIWVCASDDFSIQRLIRAIMESIDGGGCNVSELDPLQRLLQEKLRGKRYLLVLDDVWNENDDLWDKLKETINCGSEGSVVVVTSRSEKVATMMSTIGIHNVQYLSDEDSWSVFSRRAFAVRGMEKNYMEIIGKEIVKKCKGVPLAVKALGSLMRYKSGENEWLAVQTSETWQLLDDENGVLPVLRLSYDNLPLQLRQCFVYCCIFPKDCEMEKDQLIQLWMANGFLSSSDEPDLYLTGRSIFKELICRSFFQDVGKDFSGNTVCKLHDLMHDLAKSVMTHETCFMEQGKSIKFPKTLRHFCIGYPYYGVIQENWGRLKLPISKSLRSLFAFEEFHFDVECFWDFLSKQQYLRVLTLQCNMKLPSIIFELQHLRYLSINCDRLEMLPESLTRLQNLQTLKLTSTRILVELPKGMKCLKNLYFLEIEPCSSLVCMPPGLGELTCLQKLSTFIVGPDAAHQIDQLKDLNLGGDLSIRGLDNVRSFEDAKRANLKGKINLNSLSLSWKKNGKQESAEHFEEVLKGLQPNETLEEIHIRFYQGSNFPEWMSILSLPNLNKITLEGCHKCEHLPPFGKLPHLESLEFNGMDSIKCLGAEWHGDGIFPALTRLTLWGMDNLEEWTKPVSVESFPCLTDLRIEGCPKLRGIPYLSTLRTFYVSICKNMALVKSVMELTSVTSLSIHELDVVPVGLFEKHKALKKLYITTSSMRTLANELDNLSALQYLSIYRCSNLEGLPGGLTHLNSLESLQICCCDSLVSIPAILIQGVSSLKRLSIQHCKKLKYPLYGPLSSTLTLQFLFINGCPELEHLPESMQQLTELKSLIIYDCNKLCSLSNSIGNLKSLLEMEIYNCEDLKSLPDSFRNLKSLRTLSISSCPVLEKRCKKPEGEDWPKIQHIPNIRIHESTQPPISKFSKMKSRFCPKR